MLWTVPACRPRAAPQTVVERTQALIDAGNAAYSAGDFEAAAKRYASAAVDDPGEPAAFYGLGMALAKLGRDDESRAAYGKARELSRRRAQAGSH